MPQERVAIAVTGERLLQLKTLVPENTNTWTHAWANSAFRAKAFGFAETMGQRARTRITKWFDFRGDQTAEDFATKRLNKMLCHALLDSFWTPGEDVVRYDWVRAMLDEINLPMDDESTVDIADWMTRRINGKDLRVSLACAGWVRLAGG